MIFYLIRTVQDGKTLWWNDYKWVDQRDKAMEYTDTSKLLEGMKAAGLPWHVVEVAKGVERIAFNFTSV